ncbi:MAG: hypothetical protein AAFX53_13325 [Bacteroidota bacterium]
MKKEVVLPFPGYETVKEKKVGVPKDAEIPIRPRMLLRLGKPSKSIYEFVYASLHFEKHTLSDLKGLLKFQGMEVEVVSILKMKDGSSIAALRRPEGDNFSEGVESLFADVVKSIKAKELLR